MRGRYIQSELLMNYCINVLRSERIQLIPKSHCHSYACLSDTFERCADQTLHCNKLAKYQNLGSAMTSQVD